MSSSGSRQPLRPRIRRAADGPDDPDRSVATLGDFTEPVIREMAARTVPGRQAAGGIAVDNCPGWHNPPCSSPGSRRTLVPGRNSGTPANALAAGSTG